MARYLLIIFLLVISGIGNARAFEFPDQNFRFEMPAGWEKFEMSDPNILFAMRDPEAGQIILISAMKLPGQESITGPSNVRAGMKKAYLKLHLTIDAEASTTKNGIPFLTLEAHDNNPKYVVSYITSANNIAYAFQFISQDRAQDGGPALQSVLESFKLLRPFKFTAEANPSPSATFTAGYRLGRFLGYSFLFVWLPLYVLVIFGVGGFLLYRLLRKKNSERR